MMRSPNLLDEQVEEQFSSDSFYTDLDKDTETMCLFRYHPNEAAKENILAIFDPNRSGTFGHSSSSVSEVFSSRTLLFLRDALKSDENYHVLVLTKGNRPVLILSHMKRLQGLCLAVELKASPEVVLAFLKTMPSISYLTDPVFRTLLPHRDPDPRICARLGVTFRRLFSLFEIGNNDRLECRNIFTISRLMRAKIDHASRAFGIESDYLIQRRFDAPLRRNISMDMPLFSATILLSLFAVCEYGSEKRIRVIFLAADQCPAICIHHLAYSDAFRESRLIQWLKRLYEVNSCYFYLCTGENARRESEKIPGIGSLVRNDLYPIGEHVLSVFSPICRGWTEYVLHSPIFRLPTSFFDGFFNDPSEKDASQPI